MPGVKKGTDLYELLHRDQWVTERSPWNASDNNVPMILSEFVIRLF